MYDPVVDSQRFVSDDEPIVDEDLIAWVTTGLMHVPHSEDITNTATAANFASFYLRPYNFLDEDPSMASCDTVLISPAKNGKFDQSIGLEFPRDLHAQQKIGRWNRKVFHRK